MVTNSNARRSNFFCSCSSYTCTPGDKGTSIKARYLTTPGARELGPSIDVIEIRDDIVYRHCNLY
jgi:hypothetical protein